MECVKLHHILLSVATKRGILVEQIQKFFLEFSTRVGTIAHR